MRDERQKHIFKLIEENDFLKVSEASKMFGVTEMTIRRDLKELEQQGKLNRVHGGATKIESAQNNNYSELSHTQKLSMNIKEKKQIAKKAAELIEDGDIIFIGAGTTTEYIYEYLNVNTAKVVTNSISIFNCFKDDPRFDLILIGGKLRERTGTFIGYFTRKWIQDIKVQKAFIGTNGIKGDYITTAEEEEGVVQRIILNNSDKNYILADSTKFGVEAFQVLCNINILDGIITDKNIQQEYEEFYKGKCNIIK
jgi:DeoR family lactose phosphotransferase system repressor